MKIPFSPPDITEEEINAVKDALKSGWITTGPKTKEFEKNIAEFCGTTKAVCLNSATAGLELVLKIMGIGKGDEVITSAYTYTASASVIEHVGAKIVLCDINPDTLEMDYDKLEKLITNKTKAIIPVDIGGKICDYDKVFDIVNLYKNKFNAKNKMQEAFGRIIVLADGAHSFGAVKNGIKSGNIADFTSFSFHAVKNLTTAEGGAVTWKRNRNINDDELYRSFMLWSLHGQSKDALAKTNLGSWEYDIELLGQKCNMTDIAAAIGLVQLKRYPSLLKRRKEIIEYYNKTLSDYVWEYNHFFPNALSSGHLYITRPFGINEEQRNAIILKMAEKGISTNVHYKPLPLFTAYKKLGFDIKDFPQALKAYQSEITLPLHTKLSDEDMIFVAENFIDSIKEVKFNV